MESAKRGISLPLVREAAVPTVARPALVERSLTCVFALAVGLAVSWQVLREAGVVGFVHDWSIGPFADQHLSLLRQTFDGWYKWGLGSPVAYPLEYPLRLALGVAAALGMAGATMSKAFVLLVPAAAFISATYLARTVRLPYSAAWVCGIFYALDPVMLNKLVSGQTDYLIGYALLPLVPALFTVGCERGNALVAGISLGGVLALVAMEVQLGLLGAAFAGLLAAFSTRVPAVRRLSILGTAACVLAIIEAPTIVWAAHGIGGLARLDQFGHGSAWLAANSLYPADAVRLIGYLAHYDVLSVGSWMWAWQPASWAIVAVAFAGLVVLRGPLRPALLLAGALAVLVACGTTTFLGPALTWVFEHFTSAQVFRELYHVMALASLAYAVGAGSAFAAMGRLPAATWLRGAMLVALGVYVAPMLSGDVSGWLAAVPVDHYLARAFHDENEGPGRVVWFPMDQPLAFDNRGSGVDPLDVTERGSLWLYSLAWPLTAVDAAARWGDEVALRRDLRALGVAVAVQRDRLHSRYRSLPRVADFADRFFGADLRLSSQVGAMHDEGPGVSAFTLPDPLPVVRTVSRFAVVPRRMSVIGDASLLGAATFGYAQRRPSGIPYDAYFDPGDRAWEAMQASGLSRFFPEPRVDPFTGFAGGDLWWWYRPQYADARRFALAIGRGSTKVSAERVFSDGMLVVSWIMTPAGGRLALRCGSGRAIVDTGGAWGGWHSVALRCGPLAQGTSAGLASIDDGAEVALRGAQIVEASAFAAAGRRLSALLAGAQRRIDLAAPAQPRTRFVRAGSSGEVGVVPKRVRVVLEVERRSTGRDVPLALQTDDGFTVAWRHFAKGSRITLVPFIGPGERVRIATQAPLATWRLWVATAAPRRASIAVPPGPGRLVVDDETFDPGWRADGAQAHLASALGTNVFVLPRAETSAPTVRYAYTPEYRVAYFFGALLLSLALAVGLTFALNPEGRSGREPGAAGGSA